MKNDTAADNDDLIGSSQPASGGAPGFEGYLYQVDVSVWAALDLVLAKGLANAIELEPCSQEDLEAEASLPPSDPGRPSVALSSGTYRYVIQAKRRSSQPWDVEAFARLLNHGGKQRISARRRLEDPNVRYLLVTSAAVTGVAEDLRVNGFGNWPKRGLLPASLKKLLPEHADGRLGVLRNVDESRIGREVRDLLTDAFLIPGIKWKACFEELRRIARAKMTGALSHTWTREELQGVIESFEGCLVGSLDLLQYVSPTNWDELCAALEQNHAIVIAGSSGTGKTMTAEALWAHMRRRVSGLERIPISGGPDHVRKAQRTSPVLFDIEDPWGKYRFTPDSQPWNDSLTSILQTARSDRLFIVTSRDDVLHDAKAVRSISPWRVPLEPEHYGRREREKLYENRVGMLPRAVQFIAVDYRERVLGELETPFELQKFFDALRTSDPTASTEDCVKRAIKDAHHESIEKTLQAQIRERGAEVWAPIIWGLLKANRRLSRELVPDIQDRLTEYGREFESGLEQLLNFLVAGRSLRQSNGQLSYYHPRVEGALDGLMHQDPFAARRILRILCDALVSFDDQPGKDWGRTAAATVTKAAVEVEKLKFSLGSKAQANLDEWLPALLLQGDSFESNLLLAARSGSKNCAVAQLARFLIDDMPEKWSTFDSERETPTYDESWYTRIAADPDSRPICDIFVRRVLSSDRRHYSDRLADELSRLAGDLSDAFVSAALEIVNHGVTSNADAIAAGAVKNLDAFAPVVDAALEAYTSPAAAADWKRTALAISNGEYDEGHAEHLSEQASEAGYSAGELLTAYVKTLRREKGWIALRDHPRASNLLRWWLEVVDDHRGQTPVDIDEIAAIGHLAIGTGHEEKLWVYLSKHWHQPFESALLKRLTEGHPNARILGAAVACLLMKNPHCFSGLCERLLQLDAPTRVLSIFAALDKTPWYLDLPAAQDGLRKITNDWMRSVPGPLRELVAPFTVGEAERQWTLTVAAIDVAKKLLPSDESVQQAKIRFGLANGFSVEKEADELLASTDDREIAVFAFESALETGRADVADAGLSHRFAKVRARALKAVTARHTGTLPPHILRMAEDKGKYVRKALVEVLADRPMDGHFPTLVALTEDRWSSWSGNPNNDVVEHPIAYAAAQALSRYQSIPAHATTELIEVAKGTQDHRVSAKLLETLAANGGYRAREAILELAISPGRVEIRIAAAIALLMSATRIEDALNTAIQPRHLTDLPEKVSSVLTAIVGLRGDEAAFRASATHLFHSRGRKVFLIVLGFAARNQSCKLTETVANLLPKGHPSIALMNAKDKGRVSRQELDDLGDVEPVRAVLWLLRNSLFEAKP
ncbi:nSTAND3 domain-containing NTPase [Paraburkholderia terrae]